MIFEVSVWGVTLDMKIIMKKNCIIIVLLITANIFVGLSVLGVDISFGKVPSLSTTTNYNYNSARDHGQWQTVRMRVTAYCACPKCCGHFSDGITANNHKIQHGDVFAAADKKYAFMTELVVPGYNNTKPIRVMDRGGAIKGDKLDLFFHTHKQALAWGVQYLDVKIRNTN
jgi:3D (Asp-Asp-Asp) domain-containing protein